MGDVQTAASRPLWALLLLLLLALLVHGEAEREGGRVLWSGSREMARRTEQVVCDAMQCNAMVVVVVVGGLESGSVRDRWDALVTYASSGRAKIVARARTKLLRVQCRVCRV